jgi:hypothetical protein
MAPTGGHALLSERRNAVADAGRHWTVIERATMRSPLSCPATSTRSPAERSEQLPPPPGDDDPGTAGDHHQHLQPAALAQLELAAGTLTERRADDDALS